VPSRAHYAPDRNGAAVPEPSAALVSAVPVPFTADGDLDDAGLQPLYRSLDAAGVDGVFTAGTTGEFTALDDAERETVLTEALAVFGPERVYHHVGAASARQAERLAARAVALGALNLAAITPYYLPAGPRALVDYYRRLDAVAGHARIFIYLYEARSTTIVTPAQLAELAEVPSVAGAKISGEPTARVAEYIRAAPAGFEIYSGNDIEFGEFVRAGGTGGVSGVSSVFPQPFVALADALRRGDEQAAAAAQDRVKRAVEAVGGADIALIKAGLALRGLPAGPPRVALDPPSRGQLDTLRATIEELT
jgi:4-hydroxy-tetrahydrodipicolinate synthase